MADAEYPLRLQVLRALTDALLEITPANGYKSDLTGKVFRGRMWFGASDPLPMVSLLEAPQQADITSAPEFASVASSQWQILVKGDVADDKQNPTDPAHILMADVKQRLSQEKKRFLGRPEFGRECNILGMQGLVTKMDIGAGIVRPPEEIISPKAFFWLVVTLTLAEDLDQPYKAPGVIG